MFRSVLIMGLVIGRRIVMTIAGRILFLFGTAGFLGFLTHGIHHLSGYRIAGNRKDYTNILNRKQVI